MAKEAGDTADTSKAYSNRRNRNNNGQKPPVRARKQRRWNNGEPLYDRGE